MGTTRRPVSKLWMTKRSILLFSTRRSVSFGKTWCRIPNSRPPIRAYNRWITEFCRENPRRLYPVAHISLLDPEGAIEETIRARKSGCVGVYLSPDLPARNNKRFDDPTFARFWETVQDLEMPVSFHVVVRELPTFSEWTRRFDGRPGPVGLFGHAFLAIDIMTAFTSMIALGMFEKYPRLKCAVLETGATWIGSWLDRLDHKGEVTAAFTPIKRKPSEYFYRQCLVSADPDETMIALVVKHLGADYFIWASDYPHIDASFGVVKEMRERLAPLPLADQRTVSIQKLRKGLTKSVKQEDSAPDSFAMLGIALSEYSAGELTANSLVRPVGQSFPWNEYLAGGCSER